MQAQVCLSADTIQERVTINSVSFDYTVAKTTGGIVVFTKSWFFIKYYSKNTWKTDQHIYSATLPASIVGHKTHHNCAGQTCPTNKQVSNSFPTLWPFHGCKPRSSASPLINQTYTIIMCPNPSPKLLISTHDHINHILEKLLWLPCFSSHQPPLFGCQDHLTILTKDKTTQHILQLPSL